LDLSWLCRRADQHTVNAALDRQALCEDVIVRALCEAAAPFGFAAELEVDCIESRRAAVAVFIDNFNVNDRDVSSVCL